MGKKPQNTSTLHELEKKLHCTQEECAQLQKKLDCAERTRELELEEIVNIRTSELQEANAKLIVEIARRQSVESSLLQRQMRFETLADSAPVMILEKNAEGKVLFFNHALEEFLGEKPVGNGKEIWRERLHPDDEEMAFAEYDRAWEQREQFNLTYRFRRRDGAYRWVYNRGIPMFAEGNQFSGYITILLDIHSQKIREEQIQRDKEREAKLADLTHELIQLESIEDISCRVLEAARELTQSAIGFVGYKDPETGYLVCPTMTHDVWDQCQMEEKTNVFTENKGLWGWVMEHRKPILTNNPSEDPRSSGVPKGHLPIANFLGVPARIGEELTGMIALANSENGYIQEDLQLVERLSEIYVLMVLRRRAEEERQAKQNMLDAILQNAQVGISVLDEGGAFVEVNPYFCSIHECEREDLLGRDCRDFIEDPEDVERMEDAMVAMLRGKSACLHEFQLDIKTACENTRHVVATVRLIRNASNERLFVVSVTDMTERRRFEKERRQAEKEIANWQKVSGLRQMAAGIAHDFNNLLMVIIGNLEQLDEILPAHQEEERDHINDAHAASQRAAELSRFMLTYLGQDKGEAELVSLTQMVAEMKSSLDTIAPHETRIRLDLTPNLGLTVADPTRMQEVIVNLVTNAWEAMEEQVGDILIRTGRVKSLEDLGDEKLVWPKGKPWDGSLVFLEVRDNGSGMNAEQLHKMFDPFYSTKFTGRGLGLALVYGVVHACDGAIAVKSKPGAGTSIGLYFPMSPVSVEEPEAVGESHKEGVTMVLNATSPPYTRKRQEKAVLVVDDEDDIRKLCLYMLDKNGYQGETAKDGLEAIRWVRANQHRMHCILMDLSMPFMDGIESCREIRRINPDVPIIICSGHHENRVRNLSMELGLSGFLRKPFQKEDLAEALEQVLV